MKIIAVMTQKGGVGKTVTAASIAYLLATEERKKVLVVDADQQGNISMLYNRYDPEGAGMAELLEGESKARDLIRHTPYLDIITANGYIMRTNAVLLMEEDGNQITRFRNAIKWVSTNYDYCIVDCGLLMDMTVTNVLVAADMVIIPVKAGGFEIEAITNMEEQLSEIRGINKKLKSKILMTMRQKNKTNDQIQEWLENQYGKTCFQTAIRRTIAVEKSTLERVPLPKFSKGGVATQDYRRVVQEILQDFGDK